MPRKVKPIPKGYHAVTPYLIAHDAAQAISFYKKALGAKLRMKMAGPDGKVGHAELEIGDSVVMLADENPQFEARSPRTVGGSPVSLVVYVNNVDAQVKKALAAGARLVRPIENKFYGDRMGTIEDPFGYQWHLSTHIEDVLPREMAKRAKAAAQQMAQGQGA
jgi:PhnB protein